MFLRTVLFTVVFGLCACKPPEAGRTKAILGAVLIDGTGGPPLTDSAVVLSGDRIAAVGRRSNIPLPFDTDQIDGSGKYLVPAPINILAFSRTIQPASEEEARRQVSQAATKGVPLLVLEPVPSEIADAVLDAAREARIPVFARIGTQREVARLVDAGASGFVGMVRDTEMLDPRLVAKLRNLQIVFAPMLSAAGGASKIAQQNTLRLFQAGAPLAVAAVGDLQEELERLEEAGVPPLDILVAATRNGALALRRSQAIGTIEEGKRTALLLLAANPGEDIRNLRRVALRIAPQP
jgi:imidazolonepropionase-like amidohydrolase